MSEVIPFMKGSAMKAIRSMLLSALGLVSSTSTFASALFRDCGTIETDVSFRPLPDHFASHQTEHLECLRLNDREFVFTTQSNFYYCKAAETRKDLRCNVAQPAVRHPNLDLVTAFSGAGKDFALFSAYDLQHGHFGQGYTVVYLVPRSVDVRGFRIVDLEGAGASDQSEGTGECASREDLDGGAEVQDVVKPGEPAFDILKDAGQGVTVRFNQQTIECATGRVIDSSLKFRWTG